MDYMRQGIGLQGYAQKNPKNEYKIQSFNLFTKMLDNLKYQVIRTLSRIQIQIRAPELTEEQKEELRRRQAEAEQHKREEAVRQLQEMDKPNPQSGTPFKKVMHVGRNDPCPCGSGKKYKNCCGRLSQIFSYCKRSAEALFFLDFIYFEGCFCRVK